MSDKTIRIVKLDCQDACGWGIHDGIIQVEVSKRDWESLENFAKNHVMSMDFILAEAVLNLFTGDP
jgi:hypothetical protein